MRHSVTTRTLAKAAGVSQTTVSFVLIPGERHRQTACLALKRYLAAHACPDALFCESD
ncbi:MAG: hypothetical protein WC708_17290 [Lentisphaeria bacterium]